MSGVVGGTLTAATHQSGDVFAAALRVEVIRNRSVLVSGQGATSPVYNDKHPCCITTSINSCAVQTC